MAEDALNREPAGGKRFPPRLLVRRALALLAGAVFVYAGFLKVRDPLQFASDLSNYHIVPWPVGVRLAFYLPWLEIVAGLALIFHRVFAGALAITAALMLGFIGATIWTKILGINVSCGCFGAASANLPFAWHLVLNGSILAILIFLWFSRDSIDSVAPVSSRKSHAKPPRR
jgi:putative oxidoreductase